MKSKIIPLIIVILCVAMIVALAVIDITRSLSMDIEGLEHWEKIVQSGTWELKGAEIRQCTTHNMFPHPGREATLSEEDAARLILTLRSYNLEFETYYGDIEGWDSCLRIDLSSFDSENKKQIFLNIYLSTDESGYLYLVDGRRFVRSKTPISFDSVYQLYENTLENEKANTEWEAILDKKGDGYSAAVCTVSNGVDGEQITLTASERRSLITRFSNAKYVLTAQKNDSAPAAYSYYRITLRGKDGEALTVLLPKGTSQYVYIEGECGYATAPNTDGTERLLSLCREVEDRHEADVAVKEAWNNAHGPCHVSCMHTVRAVTKTGGVITEGETIVLTDEEQQSLSSLFLDADYKLTTVKGDIPLTDTDHLLFTLHTASGFMEFEVYVPLEPESKHIYVRTYSGVCAQVTSGGNIGGLRSFYVSLHTRHEATKWHRLWRDTLNEQQGNRVKTATMQEILPREASEIKEVFDSEMDNLQGVLAAIGAEFMHEAALAELPDEGYLRVTLGCLNIDTDIEYELIAYIPVGASGYAYLYDGETLIKSTAPVSGAEVYHCYETALSDGDFDDTWEERLYKLTVSGERQVNYLCMHDYEAELYRTKMIFKRNEEYNPSGLIATDKAKQFVELFAEFELTLTQTELPYPELSEGAINIELISNRFEPYALECRIAPDGYVYADIEGQIFRSANPADYSAVSDFYYENRNIPELLDGFLNHIFTLNYNLPQFIEFGNTSYLDILCNAYQESLDHNVLTGACAEEIIYVCGYLPDSIFEQMNGYELMNIIHVNARDGGVGDRLKKYHSLLLHGLTDSTAEDLLLFTATEGETIPEKKDGATLIFVFEVLEYELEGSTFWAFAKKDGELTEGGFIPRKGSCFEEYIGNKLLIGKGNAQRFTEDPHYFSISSEPTVLIDGADTLVVYREFDEITEDYPELCDLLSDWVVKKDVTLEGNRVACYFSYDKITEFFGIEQ